MEIVLLVKLSFAVAIGYLIYHVGYEPSMTTGKNMYSLSESLLRGITKVFVVSVTIVGMLFILIFFIELLDRLASLYV